MALAGETMRGWCAVILVGLGLAGCSRKHYRESADRETYPAIGERVVSPAYAIGRIDLAPAPLSRLSDPTNPDRPPKPPDDPAAALFMDRMNGIKGSSHWGKDGEIDWIEPPGWEAGLGLTQESVLKLTPDRAVEVALENSREFQTALEAVYLTALSLTLNRFEFDIRWFLRNSTDYRRVGAGSLPLESNTLSSATNFGFNKAFPAGGQLVVDFANSFVWEFTGKSRNVASSLGGTLVQPLLRNFGRKVRLESLTQAERDTLYAVREFARFRKQFWSDVAVQSGGYLDLLLLIQTVRNSQSNLKSTEENYRFYRERFKGGRARSVEVDQVYQSVLSAKLSLVRSELALQQGLDSYKLRLGLPPHLKIELDDDYLNRFVLIAPTAEQLRDGVDKFLRDRQAELDEPPPLNTLKSHFESLKGLAKQANGALDTAEKDLTAWGKLLETPVKIGDEAARERAQDAYEAVKDTVPTQDMALVQLLAQIDKDANEATEATRKPTWDKLVAATKKLTAILDATTIAQASARIHLINLPEEPIAEADAIRFAKENRLDLQNRQALVTDAWRRVTVAANALKADLNVVANYSLRTDPLSLNPVDFANEASQLSVGVQFDGPLNRQAERNAYRAALITYQRARRAYMLLSDQIELDIRNSLRDLLQQRISFEIARQSLLVAARQLDSDRLNLLNPAQEKNNEAATTRILQALNQLLAAQNGLAGSYINYEQQRVQFLLNLEALQLDARGFPTDDSLHADRPALLNPVVPAAP